jgi:putative FmdB family regulatory protein
MPLYEYKCTKCDHVAEIRHGFKENYEEPCSVCGGQMARVFSAAPVLFKGSGFYVTDSRKGEATTKPSDDQKSETKTETKPETKPETKTETKTDPKTDPKTNTKKSPSSESAA